MIIYNDILVTRTFPEEWGSYLIFFIPKSTPDKLRPISLAPCLVKILEKMINNRLSWWLERNQLLAQTQLGFRRQKSCTDNLAILHSKIQKEFLGKNHLVSVFLDIKGAYDNVLADVLITRMKAINLPENLLNFISNLTSERKLNVRIGESLITRSTYKGLPQGSALSPLLYTIYTTELQRVITNDCGLLQFADDIAIFTKVKPIQEGIRTAEANIQRIAEFLDRSGLELEPTKCKLIVFNHSKKNSTRQISMKISNQTIYTSETTKFLGVTFQENLNWSAHISKVTQACENGFKTMSCLRRTWWGADPTTLMKIYKALIRSRIEYAGFIVNPDQKIYD